MLKVDLHHPQDKMRAPWEAGNFGAIARTVLAPEAESFAAKLKIDPGAKVLDVASTVLIYEVKCSPGAHVQDVASTIAAKNFDQI